MGWRVVVENVVGADSAGLTARLARCYCGISMNNPAFHGDRLHALLDWLSSHADHCRLVIGDDLHRWTVMMQLGLAEDQALQEAHRQGDDFIRTLEPLLASRPQRFVVTRWGDLLAHPDFPYWLEMTIKLRQTNQGFMDSLAFTAAQFVQRQVGGNRLAQSIDEARALSVQYLTEEIAAFTLLSAEGWPVDVYPGPELPALVEVAASKYPDAPAPLLQRVNLQIKFRQDAGEG